MQAKWLLGCTLPARSGKSCSNHMLMIGSVAGQCFPWSIFLTSSQGLPPCGDVACHQVDSSAVGRYIPSDHCCQTQRAFLQLYGGGKNVSKSSLPKRIQKRKQQDEQAATSSARVSMVGLKGQRQAQLKNLQPATDVADLEQLQTADAASSADRQGAKHE